MTQSLLQLYPQARECSVRGLYLAHRLHELGRPELPFVYGNFVSSLDGRIALRDPASRESRLAQALTSDSDLRLLLELHAQADCLITHGGYLRAIADRRLDDILQVGTVPGHQDLASWRVAQGLQSATGPSLAIHAAMERCAAVLSLAASTSGRIRNRS